MALSGTEVDIINSVARIRQATKDQIRREVGFSLDYIGFLCRYLLRKGYLDFSGGYYSLTRTGIKSLLTEETAKIDRKLIKEVASEVAKEFSGELRKEVKRIKIPIRQISQEVEKIPEEQIKIKTDFELPIEDESLALESNINKIGAKLEKEKSDIGKSVKLFKEIQKRGRKR